MKKIFLLLVAIAACFNSFCQMKDTELENLAKELSSNEVLQEMVAANGDSLSLSGLQLLNMQLRELNMQVADFRNDISVLSHRRQSALIQGVLGSVSATAGYIWLAGQGSRDNPGPYVLMFTGGVLCISSAITWICSYTPLAKSKVSVTPGGVVVKL